MSTLVYGASDDLIELEGDLSEEFSAYDFNGHLALSNGVLLSVRYSDGGYWRIAVVRGHEWVTIIPASAQDGRDEEGYPAYSDRAVVEGPTLTWAVLVPEEEHLILS